MVKDLLEEEGLAIEYSDDEDTHATCMVVKDNIMLNVGFLKASKDILIVSGRAGIQPNRVEGGSQYLTYKFKKQCFLTVYQRIDFSNNWYQYLTA